MEVKRVIKFGNSYAVTIDKRILQKLNILPRDYVVITLQENFIKIRPLNDVIVNVARKGAKQHAR